MSVLLLYRRFTGIWIMLRVFGSLGNLLGSLLLYLICDIVLAWRVLLVARRLRLGVRKLMPRLYLVTFLIVLVLIRWQMACLRLVIWRLGGA